MSTGALVSLGAVILALVAGAAVMLAAGAAGWRGWLVPALRPLGVWPAVFAHGALNAGGGAILLLAAAGAPLDLAMVGPLGVVAWAVVAIVIVVLVLVLTGQFRREPALSGPRRVVTMRAPAA